jgi:hypothetical protein
MSKMIVFIGLDDTDNHESRGTGRLARSIAEALSRDFTVLGVTRHQLLVDARVPYTSHNSSATVALDVDGKIDLEALFERVKGLMLADFQPGSDPGLCVAVEVPDEVREFGARAQRDLVHQAQAHSLAAEHGILLAGLGGTQDGVIGALAAVGLSASGDDGRYLLVGSIRELSGLQTVDRVLAAGVASVRTLDGRPIETGLVLADKLRPARRGSQPVQFVDWQEDHWQPLKLD